MQSTADGALIFRKFTQEEGAQVLYTATFAVFLALLLVERLSVGKASEIKLELERWGGLVPGTA